MPPWAQIAITAAATVLVGWLAARSQTRAKAIEGATPSYTELDGRVARLEQQVDTLMRDLHEARAYTHVLIAERPPGMPLPRPVPGFLRVAYSAPTPNTIDP